MTDTTLHVRMGVLQRSYSADALGGIPEPVALADEHGFVRTAAPTTATTVEPAEAERPVAR
ncbi:hypothetical protein AB0H42_14520 [Nocardia sp. NPDC050799]|uniref:hypothetical protein n=1 Tax=Nocardia sp. NPDC050799 TaxID=3154842 RepID=UPI003403E273